LHVLIRQQMETRILRRRQNGCI